MFDFKVVKAFNEALTSEENWDSNGPKWNFIDADMYLKCQPSTVQQNNQFYQMFDDLAEIFDSQYKSLSFAEYTAKQQKINSEYKELFGICA